MVKCFQELKCMDFDPAKKRWVWLYEDEARSLKFGRSYTDLPKELRPLVLGAFSFHGDKQGVFDFRCGERAIPAVSFLAAL